MLTVFIHISHKCKIRWAVQQTIEPEKWLDKLKRDEKVNFFGTFVHVYVSVIVLQRDRN